MPVIDSWINQKIDEALLAENAKREAEHESSGRLSASMLYQPLRFQVLKSLGAPRKPMEAYTLGKFKRGNDVEDWYVGQLDNMGVLIERQKKVMYREAIGFVDAIVDSSLMQAKHGLMPHEVKSVTNAKLKRIAKTEVDWHYKMQGCFYALALGSEYYAVDIVSAEDLRPMVYIFRADELKDDVNRAISSYMEAMENWKRDHTLPKFEPNPKVAWTANPAYAMFDERWFEFPDKWVIAQLEGVKNAN
jgi:hypothetical protein